MKRIFKLFVVLFVLILFGCSQNANMPNPVKEYNSLDEINEKVGTNLVDLKDYGTVTDEHFAVISDKIAEYSFVIDGVDLCFRGSRVLDEDISGIYINGNPAFTDFEIKTDVTGDSSVNVYRFVINDGCQYTVSSKYQEKEGETVFLYYMNTIFDEMVYSLTKPEIVELSGDYEDTVSQRAYGAVFIYDVDNPWLEIAWSSSAAEEDEWIMELKYEGNGKFSFEESSHYRLTFFDDGEDYNYEHFDDSVSGYIEFKDGKIYMTESNIEQLKDCVFEKVIY